MHWSAAGQAQLAPGPAGAALPWRRCGAERCCHDNAAAVQPSVVRTRDGAQQAQLVAGLQAVADAVWVHHVGAQALGLQPHVVGAPGEAPGAGRGGEGCRVVVEVVCVCVCWEGGEAGGIACQPQTWSTPAPPPATQTWCPRWGLWSCRPPSRASRATSRAAIFRVKPPAPLPPAPPPLELGLQAGTVARLHAAALRNCQPRVKNSATACLWGGEAGGWGRLLRCRRELAARTIDRALGPTLWLMRCPPSPSIKRLQQGQPLPHATRGDKILGKLSQAHLRPCIRGPAAQWRRWCGCRGRASGAPQAPSLAAGGAGRRRGWAGRRRAAPRTRSSRWCGLAGGTGGGGDHG